MDNLDDVEVVAVSAVRGELMNGAQWSDQLKELQGLEEEDTASLRWGVPGSPAGFDEEQWQIGKEEGEDHQEQQQQDLDDWLTGGGRSGPRRSTAIWCSEEVGSALAQAA